MTDDFRAALQDLVEEVPRHVVPDDLAAASWTTGRRRRRRTLALKGAAAFGVLVAVGALVLTSVSALRPVAPASDGSGAVVDGYPERIGHQWIVHDLPDAPGPMAGLLQTFDEDHRSAPFVWYAFSSSGTRWRVPAEAKGLNDPTISPDGTQIAYLAGVKGPYVIQDLVTGERTSFPAIGSASGVVHTKYQVEIQVPAFWSPDGQHLLVYAFMQGNHSAEFIVLGTHGGISPVADAGYPAGWVGNDELAFLPRYEDHKTHVASIDITDTSGRALRTVSLHRPYRASLGDQYNQWTPSVSADGRLVMLRTGDRVRKFALDTGRQVGGALTFGSSNDACPLAWQGTTPVSGLSSTSTQLTVVYPPLNSSCVVWANEALSGSRHGSLFGLSDVWLAWWWRETLAGALLALLLVAGLVWVVRLRRRRALTVFEEYQSRRKPRTG